MLKVKNLCKKYPTFELDNVSFELPEGYIMGFIGMNGAGKTTTLKSILNIIRPASGEVEILGKNVFENEVELKQDIGFMLGEANYYVKTTIRSVISVVKKFYKNWDEEAYNHYIKLFKLDENKKIGELSSGMKVKFALTLALSHNAKLFIFDEPTSGLDPIAREEILELFQKIVEDGNKSILFSTHITSDLDKCADYVIFIQDGKIILNSTKDDLINKYYLIAGKKGDLNNDLISRMTGYKENAFGFTGLIEKEKFDKKGTLQYEKPNLEDIMIYFNREEK